ncbi:globoside alpha-1,3-N-acetylgalactosaminyltransferase 1-like isoform X2 [Echeneis naucrates]|uniref:globoside alpha-1,3-N-acetylgalactosaminyltransferase 1-like isoform X2 n=1 Tax=Echeneis naucrates TaxID=173247 RepID=UPI0011141DD1|nr:globoside alpha-1,3-N-acetylgalactosaminyltransferase 1-like isoform X2 [Echeneis naucrates]
MALFPLCKTPTDFLHGRKTAASVKSPHPNFRALDRGRIGTDMMVVKAAVPQTPMETPWGAPLVWGNARNSAWRRAKFVQQGIRAGLLVLVVGSYSHFVRGFLTSAELYFLPGQMVTYYILTDSPHSLDPLIELGPQRQLKVVPVAELPGWDRLAHRRMALLADAIRNPISSEVEFIFCADIDQKFVGPVGEEILGDLVATLHPELYGMPRNTFPYEVEDVSSAYVEEDEGDYYYTSELYGGLVSEMYRLARTCSLLILQDLENKVVARGLEESYLNRYLIDHRPTCVLSPEYSWWDSALAVDVPVQRLVSLGRQCESYDIKTRERNEC